MSVDTPTNETAQELLDTEKTAVTNDVGFTDLPEQELDGLIERIEQARDHNLALSGADYALLLNAVLTLANMQEQLSHNDLTIHKLKKLLGIVRASEKLGNLVPSSADGDEESGDSKDKKSGSSKANGKDAKPRTKPKRKPLPPKPSTHKHPITGMAKGDTCPGCSAGRVYKYTPATLLRIVGRAPLSAERHLCEQLRCNGCGEIYSAELPEHVKADGRTNQMYGYSARSMMSIYRYFAGSPFFRQQSS